MDDIATNELKERLARAEQMNEASCRMLEQALNEIKRLNTSLDQVRNQYEELLRSQTNKNIQGAVHEAQIDPNTGRYYQTHF